MSPRIPLSPLLQADPATLPPFRKGKLGDKLNGGLVAYIKALNPGRPPLGWVDVTPYWRGELPRALTGYQKVVGAAGFLIQTQIVIHNGQRYRRVAAALAPKSGKPNKRNR